MKYIRQAFFGKTLYYESKPFIKTVNNGYTISCQNHELISDLDKCDDVIDWFLFKVDETVLIDNKGNIFGCTGFMYNDSVELTEIIAGTYYSVSFKEKTSPCNVIPFSILIRAGSSNEAIRIASELLDLRVYEILKADAIK